jgi:SAM-dependent methyltransferase
MGERPQWESRYRERSDDAVRPPSQFLVEQCALLPPGRALDVASGDGRHALYLAGRGWAVDAIDFAYPGLARLLAVARRDGLSVSVLQADLETFPLPVAHYDLIVNTRYLQRSLFVALRTAVRPRGLIVFETFLREQAQLGHPKNPAFLLDPGELADRFRDFEILAYREGRCETESGPAFLAQMLVRRPATPPTID